MKKILHKLIHILQCFRPVITLSGGEISFEYQGAGNIILSDENSLALQIDGVEVDLDTSTLKSVLRKQMLLRGLPNKFFDNVIMHCKVNDYAAGELLANQGDDGTELFFILDGNVSVIVNDHIVDVSGPDECVGEMMLIDPLQRRCATLQAKNNLRVCKIAVQEIESIVSRLGLKEQLLINLTSILSKRLRNRQILYKCVNKKPHIFIGSTSESLCWAKKMKRVLSTIAECDVTCWSDDNVFIPSRSTMSSLEDTVSQCDFAVLFLDKVDKLDFRNNPEMDVPRDNMVFELGFCMAMLGRGRTFFLVNDAKLPSDVDGLTYLNFKKSDKSISKAATRIAAQISKNGVKR